nr:putative ferritin [Ipomoea batatas]
MSKFDFNTEEEKDAVEQVSQNVVLCLNEEDRSLLAIELMLPLIKVKLHNSVMEQCIVMPLSEFDDAEKGDALYAMELALSLEKLTNEKLLNLHAVICIHLGDDVNVSVTTMTNNLSSPPSMLSFAVELRKGNERVAKFFENDLEKVGADIDSDVNSRNYCGQTALMQACRFGHWKPLARDVVVHSVVGGWRFWGGCLGGLDLVLELSPVSSVTLPLPAGSLPPSPKTWSSTKTSNWLPRDNRTSSTCFRRHNDWSPEQPHGLEVAILCVPFPRSKGSESR